MKKLFIKKALGLTLVLVFVFSISASVSQAAGLSSQQIQAILSLLSSFGADQSVLNNVSVSLSGSTPTLPVVTVPAVPTTPSFCYNFTRNLGVDLPISSAESGALDTIFLQEEIAGNDFNTFSEAVAARVVQFQEKYNISPQSGFVGPLTRAKLNQLYGCGSQTNHFTMTLTSSNRSTNIFTFATFYDTTKYDPARITIKFSCPAGVSYAVIKDLSTETHRQDRDTSFDCNSTVFNLHDISNGLEFTNTAGSNQNVTAVAKAYGGGSDPTGIAQTTFTIVTGDSTTQPSITVLSPNGGENITQGQRHSNQYLISWTSNNLTGVTAFLVPANSSGNGVGSLGVIGYVSNIHSSMAWDGMTVWSSLNNGTAIDVPVGNYKIYLVGNSVNGGTVNDMSNSSFTIASSTSTLPPSTDRKAAIINYYDELLLRAPDDAGLSYYLNGSMTLEQIKSSILSSYEYGVKKQITSLYQELLGRAPDRAGLDYYYKNIYLYGWTIDSVRNNIKNSVEYRNHQQANSSVQVISPNGGQTVTLPGGLDVTFKPVPGIKHYINLSNESTGYAYSLVPSGNSNGDNTVTGSSASQQTVFVSVPTQYNIPSGNNYKIEVAAGSSNDKSDGLITVVNPVTPSLPPVASQPSITVLSPNGGESYSNGEVLSASYRGSSLSNTLKVYLSSSSLVDTLVSTAQYGESLGSGDGALYFNNPAKIVFAPGQYKVKICDAGSSQLVCDSSDNYFTFTAPAIDTTRRDTISSYYTNFLGRKADEAGLNYYLNNSMTLEQVKTSILSSSEYKNRRTAINNLYIELLKRAGDTAGIDYYANNGKTLDSVRILLVASYEYGVKKDISDLYRELLNREPDDAGLNYYYGKVYTDKWTLEQVRTSMKNSSEYQQVSSVSGANQAGGAILPFETLRRAFGW